MKEIPLSRGKVALVDDADYDFLAQFKWHVVPMRTAHLKGWHARSWRVGYMHRLLMPGVEVVDHIDCDGLNNQRSNLRVANHVKNCQNRRKIGRPTTSRYKGVHFDSSGSRFRPWRARLVINDRRVHLGWFDTETEAARAYNEAAFKHAGEFALLNQIEL